MILALAGPIFGVSAQETGVPFMSFEDSQLGGWSQVSWSDDPFSEISVSDEWASDGSDSLKVTFLPGEWKWGASVSELNDPDFLESISNGGTLVVDMFIPENSPGISNIGLTLQQPGAASGDWQQVWFSVDGNTGLFTIELPFTRETTDPVNIILGKTATDGQEFSAYFDNFRIIPASDGPGTLDPILLYSFESQEEIESWAFSDWSGDPFASRDLSDVGVTDGAGSMHVVFGPEEWKWGINLGGVEDPDILAALENGGVLHLDLFVPESSAGIQNIGFSFEQPNAEQPENWQQNWFNLDGQTGSFTIEIPFVRSSDGPVNFHLGKNAPNPPLDGDTFEVYFDKMVVVPNEPSTGPEPVYIEVPLFGFENGSDLNMGPTGFSQHPFIGFEVVDGGSTEGSRSLQVEFNGAEWQWGGTINGLNDLDILRAVNRGSELLVDVIIPETMTGIQNFGFTFQEQGVADSWQQVWYNVNGETGIFTVRLPYERTSTGLINLHFGQRAETDVPYQVYLDNLRVRTLVEGGESGPVATSAQVSSDNTVLLSWDGSSGERFDILSSTDVSGPYENLATGLTTDSLTVETSEVSQQFFQVRTQSSSPTQETEFLFLDDLEGDVTGWVTEGDGTSWEHGSPSAPGPDSAFSGSNVFATDLDAPYSPGTFASLRSPVIDLTEVNQSRSLYLSFRYFLDTEFESDGAIVNILDDAGGILNADAAILFGSQPFWSGIAIPLGNEIAGQKIRIEFNFFSDFLESESTGLIIDDLAIEYAN